METRFGLVVGATTSAMKRGATCEDEDDVYYHIGETKVRKGERRLVCIEIPRREATQQTFQRTLV